MAKRKHLTLRKMPCKIGSSINIRAEHHGDEDVPACDIAIDGLMLKRDEFNALVGDEHAYDALWSVDKKDKPILDEPLFKRFKPLQLRDKFDECSAVLELGLNETEIELSDISIARIKFEPQVGGLVQTSVQLQCSPPVEDMAQIIAFVNSDTCSVKLTFGRRSEASDKQKDLPLTTVGNGADEGEAAAAH